MKNIKKLLKNNLTKKILFFFNENPHCIDTAKGISLWIGCDVEEAKKSLNQLVEEGILVNHKAASINAYSYTNERHIVKEIEKYIRIL